MESTFNQRLKTILKYYDLSPTDAARKIGITRQLVDGYLREVLPRIDTVALILKAFPEVRMEWLIMDEGEMLIDELLENRPIQDLPKKKSDMEMIRECWKSDREELIKLREINRKLTEEIIAIKTEKKDQKAAG